MDTYSLRQTILRQRKALPNNLLQKHSETIFTKLVALPMYQEAQKIAAYIAVNGEVLTRSIMNNALNCNKILALPKLLPESQMEFRQITQHSLLNKNPFGILEPPEAANLINSTTLDVVLTPLVAFDAQGHRLGMGKGYYDRHFEFLRLHNLPKPRLIGLGHHFQMLPKLEPQEWDVPLDMVITEKDIIFCNKKC